MGAHAHGNRERTNQRRERRRGACRAHFRGNGALRRAGCRNGRRGTQNGAGFCFPRCRERFGGERARAFAAEIGAGAVELDSVSARAIHADIVVGCASVSEPLLSEKTLREILRSRSGKPLFLIDLGMPRNFPSGVASDELWVYGLEDLASIANENLAAREREAFVCREEFSRRAERVFARL